MDCREGAVASPEVYSLPLFLEETERDNLHGECAVKK